jgi:hypothetical protein
MICSSEKAEYFSKWDWTGQIRLIRLNKFRFSRKSRKVGSSVFPAVESDEGPEDRLARIPQRPVNWRKRVCNTGKLLRGQRE